MAGEPRSTRWWFAGDDAGDLLAQLDEQTAATGGAARGDDDRPVSQVDRIIGAGPARLGVVDPDRRKLRLARRLVAKGEPWRGRSDIWFTPAGLGATGDAAVAFLFPGVEPAAGADTIDLPGLGAALGIDAPDVSYETVAHQGASIFQLGLFLDTALRILGIEPDVAAGHSVGEWAGTVAAGMVHEADSGGFLGALDLHGLVLPELDFAAITGGVARVSEIIGGIGEVVVSHDNCPSQTIICGPPADVDVALARLRDARIIGQKLPFQSGFHTPAIAPAIDTLRHMTAGIPIGPGRIPMWSATLAAPYPTDPGEFQELHLRHLVEPVRFRELIENLYVDAGARIFVQVGMGSLAAFVDDTLGDLDHAAVEVLSAKRSALAQMHRALTALWVEGLDARPERLRRCAPVGAHANGRGDGGPIRTAPGSNGAGAVTAVTPRPPSAAPVPEPVETPAASGTGADRAVSAERPVPDGPVTPVPFSLLAASNMLTQAAAAGRQVLHALAAYYAPADAPAATGTNGHEPATATPLAPVPDPAPAPAPASAPDRPGKPWPAGKIVVTRHLSLETRPETIDHSLSELPEDWPDPSDGFPIMAMTTQIDLLREVAAEYGGGRDLIEVFGVRNLRWLDLSDPVDVDITIVPNGDDVLSLALDRYCRLNVRFGTFPEAPRHVEKPITGAHPTRFDARELFDLRLMFHGPAFQGIDDMGPIGDEGMLGTFTHLETPGSLLDNLGKLVAYWVIDQRDYIGEGALPTGLGRVRFFGPEPEPGTEVHCDIRIRELEVSQVRADGVLVLPDGRLWCQVENWTSLVFHLDEVMERLYHEPADHFAIEPQAGGWTVLRERWPGGTARDMTARRFFTRAERETYSSMNLAEQRRWILDVVAAKESARRWLREVEGVRCFPVEVSVEPDGPNHYRAVGGRIPAHCDLRITIAPLNWATVAIVNDGPDYLDIEARVVPDGAGADEAERLAAEAAAAVAERNPGRPVASVAEPDNVLPSIVTDLIGIAAAWTER